MYTLNCNSSELKESGVTGFDGGDETKHAPALTTACGGTGQIWKS